MKHLNAAIKGIHHKNPVLVVDKQSRRQLKLSRVRASFSEVIKQISLAIKYLHHSPQAIDDIQIPFRVDSNSFRPKHAATVVADLSDRIAKTPRAVQYLYAEVHGVDHDSGGTLEISFPAFQAANRALIFSAGVEHEDLARLRIRDVDIVLRIDRNALGAEHRILPFVAALDKLVLLLCEIENVNPSSARIRDDDPPMRIHRNAVGPDQILELRLT